MVIDTSAVLAILGNEPERQHFSSLISVAADIYMSAPTLVESRLVALARYGSLGEQDLKLFIAVAGIQIVAFDAEQAAVASEAYTRFGKGRHKAGLNFGDCFSYALASVKNDSLLFKGDDFSATDIRSAIHPGEQEE